MENGFKLLEKLKEEFKKVNSKDSVTQIEGAITLEIIEQTEERLNFKFPLDFREYLYKHGRFAIGDLKNADHMAFKILPLDQILTVSEILREQYDCDTNTEVADNIGIESMYINELDKLIILIHS